MDRTNYEIRFVLIEHRGRQFRRAGRFGFGIQLNELHRRSMQL
ncbi:hypothetical protein [Marinobacter sp. AC-23]